MKSILKPALLLVAVSTISACAWQEGIRPKGTLSDADFAAIKPGTAEADVEYVVGKPILKTEFKRLEESVWDYRYMYGVLTYIAEIHFDAQGRMTRIEHYPDRCPLRAIPCR